MKLSWLATSLIAWGALGAADAPNWRTLADVRYAEVDGHVLRLDLYLPRGVDDAPLLVYLHGGAWRAGTKDNMPLTGIVAAGYAVASVDYRLTTVARFPANVHDIKAAIRFLRAQDAEYSYDAGRIAIAGSSAGGHLAALVGVTNGHPELEGEVGDALGESSQIQAIVSYFGAGNFETILAQSTPRGLGVRIPALQLLLGGQPDKKPELARLASPLSHVDKTDPPLLLLHGDMDETMPINQSIELDGAYRKLDLASALEFVHGAGHGGKMFYDDHRNGVVLRFLDRHIR